MTLKKRIARLERTAKITPKQATYADYISYAVSGEKPPEGLDFGPIEKRLEKVYRRIEKTGKPADGKKEHYVEFLYRMGRKQIEQEQREQKIPGDGERL